MSDNEKLTYNEIQILKDMVEWQLEHATSPCFVVSDDGRVTGSYDGVLGDLREIKHKLDNMESNTNE